MRPNDARLMIIVLSLVLTPTSLATTWYVNGVSGSNSNNCLLATTACKTIGHAISLAHPGDTIRVAAATYKENLTISLSLKVIGSSPSAAIIDGRSRDTVVTISNADAHVTLSNLIIRNGSSGIGGGIYNVGTLSINTSTLRGNAAVAQCFFPPCFGVGGGIFNAGTLTITNSTLSGNSTSGRPGGFGGGISNHGRVTISNSTLSGNSASAFGAGGGGGIYNAGALTINNCTISANSSQKGSGIYNKFGAMTFQNSIVANNFLSGNCSNSSSLTSHGYNLSSDATCNFDDIGDLNNTDPMLGPLQNNGGPTQTMALPSGSPAIDSGNPSGCTDGLGHPLKTDQRGMPRPDREDASGCDMGAYERQSD